MNEAQPPAEPLDAAERELAQLLRSLSSAEPTAAQDARILRMAANAAATGRRSGARWLASAGAAWGIGGAAAAVLALGVGWQMKYGDTRAPQASSAPVSISSQADDEAGTAVEFKDEPRDFEHPPPPAAAAPDAAVALKPAMRAQAERHAVAPIVMPAAPVAFPQEPLDEHVARARAGAGTEPYSSSAKAVSGLAATSSMAEAAPAPADSTAQAPMEDSASAQGSLANADQGSLTPEKWLARIRVLRDRGHVEAARTRLLEFHRRYPHAVVPADLAPLLNH